MSIKYSHLRQTHFKNSMLQKGEIVFLPEDAIEQEIRKGKQFALYDTEADKELNYEVMEVYSTLKEATNEKYTVAKFERI